MFGLGAAVSATGIVTLVRATKEARRAEKKRKSQIALAFTAMLASSAGVSAAAYVSTGNVMCDA
jgi:hypothetical protein